MRIIILLPFLASCAMYSHFNPKTPSSVEIEPETQKGFQRNLELESMIESAESVVNSTPKVVKTSGIAVVSNQQVKKWIHYFTGRSKARFQRYLDRGERYRDVVESILEQEGLPPELYYLAMIESGFSKHIRSHASAVGVWQFIAGTSKRYGLMTNRYVDERRDPVRSTEAASAYLKDLFNAFNSWELAMAAYNCGERRVLSAVMRGNSRDFWTLANKKMLPRETRNYLPKFLAAVIIGQNPTKYGFRTPRPKGGSFPDVESINLPGSLTLTKIAKHSGISLSQLKAVNPHILRGRTPRLRKGYEIWVPKKSIGKVKLALKRGAFGSFRNIAALPSSKSYIVKRGDNLSKIARRYGHSISYLKQINNLNSSVIRVGQRLRVSAASFTQKNAQPKASKNWVSYRVKPGDNLSTLARQRRVSIRDIKRVNKLRSYQIYAGNRIKLPRLVGKLYRVRRGDTLTGLSRKFSISIAQLKRHNNMKRSTIYVGQNLLIPR